MQDEVCLIPRNLRRPDTIINSPIKLTMKQLIYIGAGIGVAYVAYTTAFPLVYKIVIMIGGVVVGAFMSMFKYQGASIDELISDSVVYTQRKIYYSQLEKRGDVVVNIKSRKEDFNQTISVSV